MNHYATKENFEMLKSVLSGGQNNTFCIEENNTQISNGQMLMKTFPDIQVRGEINCDSDFIEISLDGVVGWALSKQWWNAPYKVESEDNNVLDKIRAEIADTGAYEQEIKGQTEFLKGINYCLNVIDKYKAGSEGDEII